MMWDISKLEIGILALYANNIEGFLNLKIRQQCEKNFFLSRLRSSFRIISY